MPRNTAPRFRLLERRQMVASARAMGMSGLEIRALLEKKGVVNPRSGKPVGLSTVYDDMKALEDEWRQQAAVQISDQKARILAELAELKRRAWAAKDLRSVLGAIERECKVLGLDAPQVVKFIQEHEEFKQQIFLAMERVLPDDVKVAFIAFLESQSSSK
jgi:hypothetical protein